MDGNVRIYPGRPKHGLVDPRGRGRRKAVVLDFHVDQKKTLLTKVRDTADGTARAEFARGRGDVARSRPAGPAESRAQQFGRLRVLNRLFTPAWMGTNSKYVEKPTGKFKLC